METKTLKQSLIYNFTGFKKILPQVIKYQTMTKLISAALIVPLYKGITSIIIESSGLSAVSNDDLIKFLISPQGLLFLLIGLVFLVFILAIEVFGFITISSRSIMGQKEVSYFELLKNNIKLLPKLLNVGGIGLLIYLLILAPLSGMGTGLSIGKYIKVPNFIFSVIESKPLYFAAFAMLIGLMGYLAFIWSNSFHFIVIGNNKASDALNNSRKLIHKSYRRYLKRFVPMTLIFVLLISVISIAWVLLVGFLYLKFDFISQYGKIAVVAVLILQAAVFSLAGLLAVPFETHLLTTHFYECTAAIPEFNWVSNKYQVIREKSKKSIIDRIFSHKWIITAVSILFIIGMAIPTGTFINEIVVTQKKILVIGHRGGWGEGKPENNLKAIDFSIKNGAAFVEVDVQRTKDGKYILNHDSTFKRVAGDNRASYEMDLKEIKDLDIGVNFGEDYKGIKVPTVEELLNHTKDKIGIYMELKGDTADTKMADDVVKLIKEAGMEKKVVLMSLNGNLISYIEDNYPEMTTGFAYFFAMGRIDEFDSDIMVLEEEVATDNNIEKIHASGKKADVWTVNTQESMDKFTNTEIDGIITDNVESLMSVLKERDMKKASDILFTEFFRSLNFQ